MIAFEWWMMGAAAGIVLFAAYFAISYTILHGIVKTRQGIRTNPLAVATGAIFMSCGVAHGLHASHMLLPFVGLDLHVGLATREAFGEWHIWAWEAVTAGIAVWYWTLRHRFPALLRGTALFEDIRQRQKEALQIHDNVVQGLAQAKLNFEVGFHEEGMREIEKTLAASRAIITNLLGEAESENALKPGDLRRSLAAGSTPGAASGKAGEVR